MMPIADIAAIEHLKARYLQCIDSKNWTGLRSFLVGDATMDTTDDHREAGGQGTRVIAGADRIVRGIANFLGETVTAHQASSAIVTGSGDQAAGIWAMSDRLFFPNGSRMIGFGHYHDLFRRTDGGWRIAWVRVTRTRIFRFEEVRT